ncbi:MAG: Unknown protein [uncultured Campylobacterales bacterium]|uniref:GspL cytoplasmic actin-ATPase-like domain-containing protein n=1 Tax=uncultured Campylobacterales bacterium TaxID=352960 RepID=A0A6S6SRY7_9BACT|nr:MAG: Unknown protein [uncultured Campylobacterales bacterium]
MQTIFITKNEVIGKYEGICNVVLSDHYYWYKKKNIPVKLSIQAKRVASSLFLEESKNHNFEYKVIKSGKEEFVFIAYDKSQIIKKLESLGISSEQINKIHFAQIEFAKLKQDLFVNENKTLTSIEGFITTVTKESSNQRHLANILKTKKLSSKTINVKIDDKKYLVFKKSIIALGILSVVLLTHLITSRVLLGNLKEQQNEIRIKYNLPSTNFELDSIIRKYQKIEDKQMRIRDIIQRVLAVSLKEGDYITRILQSDETIDFEFNFSDDARLKKHIKLLKDNKLRVVEKDIKGNTLIIKYPIKEDAK